MRSSPRTVLATSCVTLALLTPVAAFGATRTAGSTAPTDTATEVLSFDRLPGLDRLPSTPAPSTQTMVVAIGLQNPTAAAEQDLYRRLYDPADPLFHQFLTPAEVGRRFGVSSAQRAAVERTVAQAGLRVIQRSTEGDWIAAEGTVPQVEHAFSVDIRSYVAQGRAFLANTEGPTVLRAAHVMSVIGLNTWQRWTLPRPAAGPTRQDACLGSAACIGTLTPQDLWSIYEQPNRYLGQGQSMAVIGEGNPKATIDSLAHFQHHFGLAAKGLRVVCVQNHDCGSDTSGDGEWAIDTQASLGMAPLAQETLYFAQGLEDPKIDMSFLAWINDANGPSQADASEGVCEQTPLNNVFRGPLEPINGNDNYKLPVSIAFGDDQEPVIDQALRHAAIEGRTLFSSTGDTGFTCASVLFPVIGGGNGVLYNGTVQVAYPASSAYAVAVGGTVIYSQPNASPARRVLEYGWNFGGGGSSYFQPAPAFQHAQPNVIGHCISSPSSFTSGNGPLCRGIPDVAALSGDFTTGYTIVDAAGNTGSGGGTSLSSPLWMGMWTRVQSAALKAGAKRGLGFANETLYALGNGAATQGRDFTDVNLGDNGYPALPGWDYVTGFGTPRLSSLTSDALLRAHLRP